MKGWVGLVGWPTADGLPTEVVSHQLQVERRTGKVRLSKTDVLPTVPRNQRMLLCAGNMVQGEMVAKPVHLAVHTYWLPSVFHCRYLSADLSLNSPAINNRTRKSWWHFCSMDCTRTSTGLRRSHTSRQRKQIIGQTRLGSAVYFDNVVLLGYNIVELQWLADSTQVHWVNVWHFVDCMLCKCAMCRFIDAVLSQSSLRTQPVSNCGAFVSK